jgi:hypothetical protein
MPGVFQIVSRGSGKALSVAPDGVYVAQNAQDPSDSSQFWTLTTGDDPSNVVITATDFGQSIATEDPDPTEQSPLVLGGPELWRVSRLIPSVYFFSIEGPNGLVMDVPGNSRTDGQIIQVFRNHAGQNQQWTFLPVFAYL